MHRLETRIPPPVLMFLLGGIAWVAARSLPSLSIELPFAAAISAVLMLTGLTLNILPKFAFRRTGTTVNPMRPNATTHLVTSSLYRYSRNPMYLGHSLLLLGWTLHLHNIASLLATPAFMIYVSRFQIGPEERQLSARFQDEYAAFCQSTPRWL